MNVIQNYKRKFKKKKNSQKMFYARMRCVFIPTVWESNISQIWNENFFFAHLSHDTKMEWKRDVSEKRVSYCTCQRFHERRNPALITQHSMERKHKTFRILLSQFLKHHFNFTQNCNGNLTNELAMSVWANTTHSPNTLLNN